MDARYVNTAHRFLNLRLMSSLFGQPPFYEFVDICSRNLTIKSRNSLALHFSFLRPLQYASCKDLRWYWSP